jgi:hypothetical protein
MRQLNRNFSYNKILLRMSLFGGSDYELACFNFNCALEMANDDYYRNKEYPIESLNFRYKYFRDIRMITDSNFRLYRENSMDDKEFYASSLKLFNYSKFISNSTEEVEVKALRLELYKR